MVPLLLLLPLLWGGEWAWEGGWTGEEWLGLQLSFCVPPESLQEKEGYELQVRESVRVQEGLCIHVPCSFSYPRSLWFPSSRLYTSWYWSEASTGYTYPVATNSPYIHVKKQTQGRFLLGDPTTNNCSISIRDARKSDTGTYVFQVDPGYYVEYTYQDKKLTLQVTGTAGV